VISLFCHLIGDVIKSETSQEFLLCGENTIMAKLILKWVLRSAASQILMGRMIEHGRPERGRFLKHDVDSILKTILQNVDEIMPKSNIQSFPTLGNRQNAFLAILTIAAYRALLDFGIERNYAIELFSDLGWKIYTKFITIPRLAAQMITRDPQRQINLILRMMMVYPFSAPGRPGYEVQHWAEDDHYCTYWTYCAPLGVVKRFIEENDDRGDIEAFYKSWCSYDWAFTHAMVNGGYQRLGHYERPNTLSLGADVCDMKWYAIPPKSKERIVDTALDITG
jgi:hypothetical protein